MTRPIDIVTAALRASDDVHDEHGQAARARAVVAVNTLTDERVVAHATERLRLTGLGEYLSNSMLEHAARTVLRSVGEA